MLYLDNLREEMVREYESTHPWLQFHLDLEKAPVGLWIMLGECQSKVEHMAGTPLRPEVAQRLHRLYLTRGALATTAIEGNTLSEVEALALVEKRLELPPSRRYLQQEIENIVVACNQIGDEIASGVETACSSERIRQFNRLVLDGLDPPEGGQPGEVTDFQVVVGRYRAAPRKDCEYLLDRLCQWLNGDTFKPHADLTPIGACIIKAVVAHLYLVWIHPFGDGNGRTARLVEFDILLGAGTPSPAAHLLSNHYNLTRTEYYRQLDGASRSGGNLVPFLLYALQGLRDGLRQQIQEIRTQQRDVVWRNFIHERFRDKKSKADLRRRNLLLDLSRMDHPVDRESLRDISTRVRADYSSKGDKTLSRDINILLSMSLLRQVDIDTDSTRGPGSERRRKLGVTPNVDLIDAFLPIQKPSSK